MRLLIATPLASGQPGGPAQYSLQLAEALREMGHEVRVSAFTDVMHYPTGIRHGVYFFKILKETVWADTLIVLDTFSVALPSVLAGLLLRTRTVVRVGGDFIWERYVERTKERILLSDFYTAPRRLSLKEKMCFWLQKHFILPRADAIVFSTAWQQAIWQTPYAVSSHVHVIENAYGQAQSAPGPQRDGPILWVGRDIVLKNREAVRTAIHSLEKASVTVPYEECVSVPHETVLKKLAASRALIIPSFSEVSPNLAAEALSLGTPVILTKDCGWKERFEGHVTWIDPFDQKSIEKALRGVMDEESYKRMLQEARSFAGRRSYHDIAGEFMNLIRNIS